MQFLTKASLWLEIVGPLLAFSPWLTKWFRGTVVALFVVFHVGVSLCLTIGLFPAICIVCWLVFVPGEFWEWLKERLSRALRSIGTMADIANLITRWMSKPEVPALRRRWYLEVAVGCLLVYVVLWNVRETNFKDWEPVLLSRNCNAPARILGLDQNWSMFAPLPRTEDGWLVMEGTLRDGSTVNLWDFDQPLPWDKPELRVPRTERNGGENTSIT